MSSVEGLSAAGILSKVAAGKFIWPSVLGIGALAALFSKGRKKIEEESPAMKPFKTRQSQLDEANKLIDGG